MDKQNELLNLLVLKGIIKEEDLLLANGEANKAQKNILDVLIEKKMVDQEKVAEVKAEVFNIPYKSLLDTQIETSILNIIPKEVADNYKIICFNKDEGRIQVGLVDPNNFKAIEAVDFLAKRDKLRAEFFLISEISYEATVKQYKTLSKEVTTALHDREQEKKETVVKEQKKEENLEEITKSAPVAKIVSVIIRHAIEGRASDIHIEPLRKESRIRYRIDGVMRTSLVLPKDIHSSVVARIKVLANLKLDETRIPQDGRIRISMNNKEIDLRVSVLPLVGEEKVVMRILDVTRGAPTLEDLGFSGIALEIIRKNIEKTDGMFLVTGPTGSGKSTTLFSVLNIMNKDGVNISTLEDPVEYFIKGVNQSQVRPEIGFTFASGLRALLRQDPDVIMVGEIRDNETAELAVHAGLTGHFVLSTLHTNDAIGALPRLFDMGVEPFLLGSTINTVIAQRLARKICSFCKKEDKVSDDILEGARNELNKLPSGLVEKLLPGKDLNGLTFYKGSGCPRCGNSGYSGRVAIAEVIDINDKIKEIITDKTKTLSTKNVMESQDYVNMYQDGIIKAVIGSTTMEEVLRVVHN